MRLLASLLLPLALLTQEPKKVALFSPLPGNMASGHNPMTDPKVKLGRMLYYEP